MSACETDDEWVGQVMRELYNRRIGWREWLEIAAMAEAEKRMFLAHALLLHAVELEADDLVE